MLYSSDPQEVERFYAEQFGITVHLPRLADSGFVLQGGGMCPLPSGLRPHIIYEKDGQFFSLFSLPPEDIDLDRFTLLTEVKGKTLFLQDRQEPAFYGWKTEGRVYICFAAMDREAFEAAMLAAM